MGKVIVMVLMSNSLFLCAVSSRRFGILHLYSLIISPGKKLATPNSRRSGGTFTMEKARNESKILYYPRAMRITFVKVE